MYVYICIHVYMYISVYMYICIYYMYVYLFVHIHVHVHVFAHMHLYAYAYAYVYVHENEYAYVHVYACVDVYVYVYVHVCKNPDSASRPSQVKLITAATPGEAGNIPLRTQILHGDCLIMATKRVPLLYGSDYGTSPFMHLSILGTVIWANFRMTAHEP